MTLPNHMLLSATTPVAVVSKTLTFLQGTDEPSNVATYEFVSQNLGAADSGRHIIACVMARKGSAFTISSVTIGGVSATEVIQVQSATADGLSGIYVANVPTGTTGTVTVVLSSDAARCAISLYSASGITTTPYDSASSTATAPSATIDVVAGGFAIGAAESASGTGVSDTCSWTNLTEDYESEIEDRQVSSTASASTPTTTTLTATATFTNASLTSGVFASW